MWTCPKCGETSEDQFDSCWNCVDQSELNKPPPPPTLFGRILGVTFKWVFLGLVAGIIVQAVLNMLHKAKPSEMLALHQLTAGFEDYATANGRPPRTWEELETVRDLHMVNKTLQEFELPAPIQSNYYFVTNTNLMEQYNRMPIVLIRNVPVKFSGVPGRFAIVGGNYSSNYSRFRAHFLPNDRVEQLFRDAHEELKTVKSTK